MSTRSISWAKGGRRVRLTTYQHPVPLSRDLGNLTSWNTLDPSVPVTGLLYHYFSLLYKTIGVDLPIVRKALKLDFTVSE